MRLKMIKTIIDNEEFKTYETESEAREDITNFFKFTTSYKVQETTDFKQFIENIKNLPLIEINKMDYNVKFELV